MIKNQEEDEFVAVRVQDPRVQNEGFWNSYVDYKIFLHTNSKAFTAKTSCVRRRYSEFVWLKKNLQKNSGLVPVPDLPGKSLFSFSNEEFLEKRRKGLQFFLDKVLHMTVCLSDSQLHLFLQTQLPIGHIVDCVQGHTPYTVTDAILTYASSNRGWVQAQEEDDLIQEPSLTPVSYESMESPAPHLPTLPSAKAPELLHLASSESEEHIAEIHEYMETMELQLNESEMPPLKSQQGKSSDNAAVDRISPEDITISGDTQGEQAAVRQQGEEEEVTQLLGCRLLMPVEVHSPLDTDADGVAETEESPENEGTAPCLQGVPVPTTHKEAGREGSPEEDFPQVSSQEQVQVDGNKDQSSDAKSNGSIDQDPNQEQIHVKEPYSEISEEAEPNVAIASAVDDDVEGRSETPVKNVELIDDVKQEVGRTESNGLDCDGDSRSESDIESIQEESELYMQTALPEDERLHSTEVSRGEPLDCETNGEATRDHGVAEVTEAEETNSCIHLPTDSTEDLSRDLMEPQSNGNPTNGATLDEVTTDQEQKHCYIETVQSVKRIAQVHNNAESAHEETVAKVSETCEEINSSIDTVPEEECEEQGEEEEEDESFSTDGKEVEVSVKQTAQVQNNPESAHETLTEGNETQEEVDPYIEAVIEEQEEEEGEEEEDDESFSTDGKEVEVSVRQTAQVQNNPESAHEETVAEGNETQEEIDPYIETVIEEQEEDEQEEDEEQKEEQEEEREEEQDEKDKKLSPGFTNSATLEVQANGDPTCDISTQEVSVAQEGTVEINVPVPASEDAPGLFYLTNGGPHRILELESSRTVEGEDEHKG